MREIERREGEREREVDMYLRSGGLGDEIIL